MTIDSKVEPGVGWGEVVLGAKLDELESKLGAPTIDNDTKTASWGSLGVFIGFKDGVVTSVAGNFTDPFDWLFAGKLTPFAGEITGVTADSSAADIEGSLGPPLKADQNTPWQVLYYDGIYFTFFEGVLSSFTIGGDGEDDDEDDEDDDDDDDEL